MDNIDVNKIKTKLDIMEKKTFNIIKNRLYPDKYFGKVIITLNMYEGHLSDKCTINYGQTEELK